MRNRLNAEIAGNVQAIMKSRGVTQQALTEETGISDRTLRRRLTGSSAWSTDELAAIADALTSPDQEVTVRGLLGSSRAIAYPHLHQAPA